MIDEAAADCRNHLGQIYSNLNANGTLLIISIGDKFAQTMKILDRLFGWSQNTFEFPPRREQGQPEAAFIALETAYNRRTALWTQAIRETKERIEANNANRIGDQAFFNAEFVITIGAGRYQDLANHILPNGYSIVNAIQRCIASLAQVVHVSVRPRVDPLDMTYYEDNASAWDYQPSLGRPTHKCFVGTI